MSFELNSLRRDETEAVATLLHQSLVHWYETHLQQGARFGSDPKPFAIFPDVYHVLDPEEAIAARDVSTGNLLGVCFVHPRETHFSVGIVSMAPEAAGKGVAKAMMAEVIKRAEAAGKPVRLVSSLLNLDSFSLYTKMGFVPETVFQDLLISIPEEGLKTSCPKHSGNVRLALPEDATRLADFEMSWQGIRREQDYHFFLNHRLGKWKVWLSEDVSGEITGFLVASLNPEFRMLGPGVIGDETTALALLWHALDDLRGQTYVFLAPASASGLIRTLYTWGARNVELHVSQVYGETPVGKGLVFPTFLPESG